MIRYCMCPVQEYHSAVLGRVAWAALIMGKAGFDTFSHQKVVLKQSNEIELPLRYEPNKKKLKWVRNWIH